MFLAGIVEESLRWSLHFEGRIATVK